MIERLDEFSSEEIKIAIEYLRRNRKEHQAVILKHESIFGSSCDGPAYLERKRHHEMLCLWETQLHNALNTVKDRERTINN